MRLPLIVLSGLLAIPFSVPARAGLLVYDGFNYEADSTLIGTKPGAGTVGLNTATAYATQNPGAFTVESGSLSFGDLVTSGNSVRFTTATSVASAQLSLASAFTGTLWSSYLITLDSPQGGATADGVAMRVSNAVNNSNERFQSLADSRNSSTRVATNYGSGNTDTNATTGLATGTTYLLIARFTNVGESLSAGTPGTATVWALTVDQFADFIAAGGTEAYLDSATVTGTSPEVTAKVTGPATTSGTYSFGTGNYMQFVSVNNSGVFDELRFGSSLADVTPIPEPAAVAVAAGLAAGFVVWLSRRRRRAG